MDHPYCQSDREYRESPSLSAFRPHFLALVEKAPPSLANGYITAGELILDVALLRSLDDYVADDMSRALEEPQASIMQFYRQLGEQLEASAHQAGARAVEQRDVRGRRLQEITFDEVLRDKVIVGTPDVVTQRLKEISDDLSLDGILAELNSGGLTPRAGLYILPSSRWSH